MPILEDNRSFSLLGDAMMNVLLHFCDCKNSQFNRDFSVFKLYFSGDRWLQLVVFAVFKPSKTALS